MPPADQWSDARWAEEVSSALGALDKLHDETQTTPHSISASDLAQTIDHTLLKLDATPQQIDQLCDEAKKYGFKTVCVRLPYVEQCRKSLDGTQTGVACVVGFHEGSYPTEVKLREAKDAITAGASELDIVLNFQLLLTAAANGLTPPYSLIYSELAQFRELATVTLKLILETSQLDHGQIVAACVLAWYAGFDFVKTSTGFCGRGASVDDVGLMKSVATALVKRSDRKRGDMLVKASGGIRDFDAAITMIKTGASRLGVSAGVGIVEGARAGLSDSAVESGGY